MNYLFITGTSSGIGNALANNALDKKNFQVIGIGRTCNIQHERYQHIFLDLKDVRSIDELKFDKYLSHPIDSISLVNNAASLQPAGYVGKLSNEDIVNSTHVNFLLPLLLINSFVKTFRNISCKKTILNVSSGAAQNPIDGWGVYCATKAGLEMFSKVFVEESELSDHPIRLFSVTPGVVDTPMQAEIRDAGNTQFSRHEYFVSLKKENQLISPQKVADKFIHLILHPEKYNDSIFRLNY